MKDGDREIVTAIETVAADGSILPPMLIYKGKGQLMSWHKHLSVEDKDTVFSYSDKGWTNQILGVKYLEQLFEPQSLKRFILILCYL